MRVFALIESDQRRNESEFGWLLESPTYVTQPADHGWGKLRTALSLGLPPCGVLLSTWSLLSTMRTTRKMVIYARAG